MTEDWDEQEEGVRPDKLSTGQHSGTNGQETGHTNRLEFPLRHSSSAILHARGTSVSAF